MSDSMNDRRRQRASQNRREEARAALRDQVAALALELAMKDRRLDLAALGTIDETGRRLGVFAYMFADAFLAARGDRP